MILVLVIYPLDVEWFNWVFAVSGSGQFRRLGPRKLPNETITECTRIGQSLGKTLGVVLSFRV